MRALKEKNIYRILDANYNRAKEALRVCEDIGRFIFNSPAATQKYKALRHRLEKVFRSSGIDKTQLLVARNIPGDVGQRDSHGEYRREDIKDIFFANSQRAKESVRVLEEFSKLLKKRAAQNFKKIRYALYDVEREIFKKF